MKTYLPIASKYGLLGGFLGTLMFLILYWGEENPIHSIKIFDFFLIGVMVFFCLKEFRDYENDKNLNFIEGIKLGLITSFFIGVVGVIFLSVFLGFIEPEILNTYKKDRISYLMERKDQVLEDIDEEVYNSTIREIKTIAIKDLVLDEILRKLIIGLFLSIIFSLILRRNPRADHGK